MRGFALMDVATGAAIMGIVVVGTMFFFSYGQKQIQGNARERAAYDLLHNRVEELVAAGYDKAVARTDTGLVAYNVDASRITSVSFVDDPADSLGVADADGNLDYKDIQVDVTYLAKTISAQMYMYPEE